MQINLDVVVAMRCRDLHVNIQDASGDRILAGVALSKDDTRWQQWTEKNKKVHKLERSQGQKRYEEEDVHDYLGASKSRKFPKTPRYRGVPDACRVYGSLDANRVQGDFHITARGHGYMEFGEHLDHNRKRPTRLNSTMSVTDKCARRVQLLAPDQRALFRPLLSLAHQPARLHARRDADA